MGSWLTFHVFSDRAALAVRTEILREFFAHGGMLLDSSPMYGRSEAVLGHCLTELGSPGAAFRATKVWILGQQFGINQMEHSGSLWGQGGFDLMQVHNLLDWDTHLGTLKDWKAAGRIRYLGVTTSHGRRHDDLETIMRAQPLDFVQFTYNFADRSVEERLLPLAAERGMAVIINRPFDGGDLFDSVAGTPLPGWAPEIGCANWAQVFLKFVVSHPAVTCAIPATSQVAHMQENMGALTGMLPDAAMRERMLADFRRLI
jgi:diketogulonate reductase-like aldo/keto reductase